MEKGGVARYAKRVDLLDSFVIPTLCGGGRKYSALFNWSKRT